MIHFDIILINVYIFLKDLLNTPSFVDETRLLDLCSLNLDVLIDSDNP